MNGAQGFEAVVQAIRDGRKFVITSHVAQDGDNVSAQLALALILDALGKEVVLVDADPIPERWKFLPVVARIHVQAAMRSKRAFSARDCASACSRGDSITPAAVSPAPAVLKKSRLPSLPTSSLFMVRSVGIGDARILCRARTRVNRKRTDA